MMARIVLFTISIGLVTGVAAQMIFLPPYHPQYQQQQFTIQTQQQPVNYQTHQPELDYQTALLQQQQLQQQQLQQQQIQQQQTQTQSNGQQFQTIRPLNWNQLQAAYYQNQIPTNQFTTRGDMSTSQVLPPVLPASPRWPVGTNTTTNTTTTTITTITHPPARPPVNITIVMLPTSRSAEAVQPAGSALPTPMPVTSNVTTIGTNPTPFFQSHPSNYSMKDEIGTPPEVTTNLTTTKNPTSSLAHSVRSFFSSLLPGGPIGPIGGPIGPGPFGPKGPGPFGPFGPKKP